SHEHLFALRLPYVRRRPDAPDALAPRGDRLGNDFQRVTCAASLHYQSKGAARARADRAHERLPGIDALAIDADYAVSFREPRLRCRASLDNLPDHRLELRAIEAQADALERIAFDLVRGIAAQVEDGFAEMAALAFHLQAQRLALESRLQHAPAQVLPGRDRGAVDRAHRV